MFQNSQNGGDSICDCQKAFGGYSAIDNEMDNSGIYTSIHFKFEWKFEMHSMAQLEFLRNPLQQEYSLFKTFLPSRFISSIFRPPSLSTLHTSA